MKKIYIFGTSEEITTKVIKCMANATDNKYNIVSRAVYYPEYDMVTVVKNILLTLDSSDFIILLNDDQFEYEDQLFVSVIRAYALLHDISTVELSVINGFMKFLKEEKWCMVKLIPFNYKYTLKVYDEMFGGDK